MKIEFPESYRCRLNDYKLVQAGEYDTSKFSREFVDYCLEHGKAHIVNTDGRNHSNAITQSLSLGELEEEVVEDGYVTSVTNTPGKSKTDIPFYVEPVWQDIKSLLKTFDENDETPTKEQLIQFYEIATDEEPDKRWGESRLRQELDNAIAELEGLS